MVDLNRAGKSYRHLTTDAIVTVVASKPMSHSTARHTILVLYKGSSKHDEGTQMQVDEIPTAKWFDFWVET